ncbi:hypothetical protein [Cysteiniphilum halobium]|uniref:hypothetical protein n=1 Tax=Cysteiniphilum halobium TaxID=2219059 RepID=UPI000E64FC55|nr:hypothetical protein [Cysteiniphilum halobium]
MTNSAIVTKKTNLHQQSCYLIVQKSKKSYEPVYQSNSAVKGVSGDVLSLKKKVIQSSGKGK